MLLDIALDNSQKCNRRRTEPEDGKHAEGKFCQEGYVKEDGIPKRGEAGNPDGIHIRLSAEAMQGSLLVQYASIELQGTRNQRREARQRVDDENPWRSPVFGFLHDAELVEDFHSAHVQRVEGIEHADEKENPPAQLFQEIDSVSSICCCHNHLMDLQRPF